MLNRILVRRSIPVLVIAVCFSFGARLCGQEKGELPITTNSPEALKYYHDGLRELRAYNFAAAQDNWRKAIELDPNFAMAHLHLAFVPVNPMDQAMQVQKAIASRDSVSPGEQKLLDWLANAMQGKMISAVQAMNDALSMYPEDNTVNWGAALWLQSRGACDRAIPIYERVLSHDKDFTPAWRGLGECQIRRQDFDKGFAAMKKYVALLPQQPTPEIYYGMALVRADRYDEGITHCQAALDMDANSLDAWRCIAMAHALKGEGKRARTEYERIVGSQRVTFALSGAMESAATYVQEKNFKEADRVFGEAAVKAHESGFGLYEAEAYRSMAIYQADNATAMELLKKAEAEIGNHQITRLDRNTKLAAILQLRVILALRGQDMETANAAAKQLQDLAENGHFPSVEHAAAGAAGAILVANKKYAEAIDMFEEDQDNPFSLQMLIVSCQKTGRDGAAKDAAKRLMRNNSLAVDQVMVLAEFRKQKFQLAAK